MLAKLRQFKLVPLVVLQTIEDAIPALNALNNGGLPIAEIALRTECAADAIELCVKEFPDMLIGAGTVINKEQCERALSAGAKFVVSPGLSKEVAEVCKNNSIPYIPGVITPMEIMQALSLGLNTLKFFPAESFGGINTLKSLSAAFPEVCFMPTGGIDENNLKDYLNFNKVIACGGSFMMKDTPEKIEAKTRQALRLINHS